MQLKSRFILALLILTFFGPVIAASIVYWQRAKLDLPSSNYGTFVQPLKIKLNNEATLEKKWTLLFVTAATCDADCQHKFYLLQNLRKSLPKDLDKIAILKTINKNISNDLKITTDAVLLVNPQGEYIMRYNDEINLTSVKKIRRDLKRLLMLSHAQ